MTIFHSPSKRTFYDDAIHSKKQIPKDAVEITAADHAALLAAQADGKMISADKQGNPIAIDRPAPTADEIMASARRKRNALLAASDWVVTRAVETGTPVPAEWSEYRQALRDITEQAEIIWPEKPL